MKISLDLIRDSFNSHPQDSLEFVIRDEFVSITVDDNGKDRELVVDRSDFVRLLKAIEI
jgi:hypothetical protein